ncbi:hypothetical protein D3C87_2200080 [compost metagenome]
MEMTDRHASIVPLMLSAFTSILVAKLLNKEGFYELAVNDYLKTLKESSDEQLVAKPERQGN